MAAGVNIATLTATLVADTSRFNTAMKDAAGTSDKTGGSLKRTFASAFAGVASFEALRRGVGAMIGEYNEARKVGATTNAIIKATKGAANISAQGVSDLAGAISRKVAIDDEAIQTGANLLLTFRNVRNEVGKGNDIFNQATAAAVDLSAAGFGSIESASVMLGKALNDPVRGLTALQRAGVQFTDKQRDQVKALLATGKASDRLKAQQLILKEVQGQVGGTAAAQATPMKHFGVMMGNAAEFAGGLLVPALEVLITTITSVGRSIVGVVNWFRQHETVAIALGAAVGVLTAAFVAARVAALIPMIPTLWANVAAWTALKVALLTNPFVLVAAALAALVAGVIIAYRESETFRAIVDAAFNAVKTAASALWNAIKTAFNAIVGAITAAWDWIKGATEASWRFIRDKIVSPIRDAFNWVKNAVSDAVGWLKDKWENIKANTRAAWDWMQLHIGQPIRDAMSWVKNAVSDAVGWLAQRWENIKANVSAAWGRIKDAVVDKAGAMIDFVKDLPARIVRGLGNLGELLLDAGRALIQGLINGVTAKAGELLNKLKDIAQKIRNIFPFSEPKDPRSPLRGLGKSGAAIIENMAKGMRGATAMRDAIPALGAAAPSFAAAGAAAAGGSGGGPMIVINNPTFQSLDPQGSATAVIRAIDEWERRNGPRFSRA